MQTQVLIIGGGATGTGLARDLALRGVHCILVEQNDINNGASGSNHGLLHSGARYVSTDGEAAEECRTESDLLKKLAPHCIENTGGLFVAVEGDDENYAADFPGYCSKNNIPFKTLDPKYARELEPALSKKLIAAYAVEDASIDPFKLSLENIGHAVFLGATLLRNTRVTGFSIEKGKISATHLYDKQTNKALSIKADYIVNSSGAWAGDIASMAGIDLTMHYSKGTLLVTGERITHRVINRLRPASDADILVPGGTVSIIGTTSVRTESLTDIRPTVSEVDLIIDEGSAMIPELQHTRYIRAYAGVRPLTGAGATAGDRSISRGFALLDHAERGIENFTTITGGKLTTYRLMAEKCADHICEKIGVREPCKTRTIPLPDSLNGKWTEPGLGPKEWLKNGNSKDSLLCECEMVSKSFVNEIVSSIRGKSGMPTLNEIALRSRIGKGPCQGSFCSLRVAAHMFDEGVIDSENGLNQIKEFINERWKGHRPLLRGNGLVQSDLQEAYHSAFLGLDL